MSKRKKRYFELKSVVKVDEAIKAFNDGQEVTIPTSDLSVERNGHILQWDLVEPEDEVIEKYPIKPGIFDLVPTASGIKCAPMKLKDERMLESFSHTTEILREFTSFFNKLDVYEKLGLQKRRGILLYGPPGTGKTQSILTAVKKLRGEDKGTVVINWNSDKLRATDVMDFFAKAVEFTAEVTRLVIIIEDIGTSAEGYSGPKQVDSSLLNFLDGGCEAFSVPVFTVATTNYAEQLPENLINRPGRFSAWLKIGCPTPEERVVLMEFIGDGKLTEEDKKVILSKDCDSFTASHLRELNISSLKDEVSIAKVVKRLLDHQKEFNYKPKRDVGLGL